MTLGKEEMSMYWSDFYRPGRFWDPWRDIERVQRALHEYSAAGTGEFPAVNIWSNGEEAIVTLELPGIDARSVDISVVGKTVTLRGGRQAETVTEGESYHRQERWAGHFSRTIDLPFMVDAGKVGARFSRGILTITLPRTEADKPRKINVVSE
jgi:HSP20 family protein